MSEKIHVGVMMENLDCSVYLGEMITELASEDTVELHLLLTEKRKVSFRAKVLEKVRSEGIVRFFSICFFNIIESVETYILKKTFKKIRRGTQSVVVGRELFCSETNLRPVWGKKNSVKFGK